VTGSQSPEPTESMWPVPDRFPSPEPIERSRRSEPVPVREPSVPEGATAHRFPVPPHYRGEPVGARTCQRSVDGPRVIPGRHAEPCAGQGCDGCLPCPENHCSTCHREHADQTCPTCRAMARLNLAVLSELHGHLPAQAVRGRQAWHEHSGLLGGDATVMLTPASTSWPAGDTRTVTSEPGDVRPPLDVLASWINRWSKDRHDSRPLPTHDFGWCVDHLDSQLHSIAATLLFAPLARDLARVVYSLETVLHAGDRPDVSRVPCWDCGTRLHLIWTDQADHDYWRCPVCGQTFDHLRYVACRHYQLASRGADRFVTVADAVAVIERPEATVRAWARDGLIGSRRTPGGHVEVWWPDVRERDLATPTRRRIPR
jgi:hypothetical protein